MRLWGLRPWLISALCLAIASACVSRGPQGSAFKDCSQCPMMVALPAGQLLMGSTADEPGHRPDETPQHPVTISRSFAIGRYEVTRREYEKFVNETRRSDPPKCFADRTLGKADFGWVDGLSWRNPGYQQTPTDPAVCISWNDARDYTVWLSVKTRQRYRLPSEAEWEYAARAGSSAERWWGDDLSQSCKFANVADRTFAQVYLQAPSVACSDGYVQTAPVGRFTPNPFGLYDLFGNAWEWVEDCRNDSYDGAPSDGSAWSSGNCAEHGRRGGSWFRPTLRAAERSFLDGSGWHVNAGFRVVREMSLS